MGTVERYVLMPAYASVKTTVSCCNTDNCDPPALTFPDKNHQKNGKVCRSCVTANSDWCYTSDTIECSGNETMCMLQTTKISGIISLQTALRGCATRSLCDYGVHRIEAGGVRANVEFICTDGSSKQKAYFSGIFALALLSLFY
ncbi:hypothetical protein GDO81_024010 [Engystomops pustulosus]|uniref:UPAR/Ly6 domain-containing protein n=1 Tax=Engystomops pustulosus TaxID=76066 RepID=A0AAV6ZKX7_ENGPU|nr:hypothetical protein GDO81_024010 [Engystomops pustulosus]